jgi:hypothetical protein
MENVGGLLAVGAYASGTYLTSATGIINPATGKVVVRPTWRNMVPGTDGYELLAEAPGLHVVHDPGGGGGLVQQLECYAASGAGRCRPWPTCCPRVVAALTLC